MRKISVISGIVFLIFGITGALIVPIRFLNLMNVERFSYLGAYCIGLGGCGLVAWGLTLVLYGKHMTTKNALFIASSVAVFMAAVMRIITFVFPQNLGLEIGLSNFILRGIWIGEIIVLVGLSVAFIRAAKLEN